MATGSRNEASSSTQGTEPIDYDQKTAAKFQTKSQSHYIDPCQDFAERSIKCLHRNGNDKDLCNDYFQAYRDCKKQWLEARREQRRKDGRWF